MIDAHQDDGDCRMRCSPLPAAADITHVMIRQVEPHKSSGAMRGYIAMLVVQKPYRGAGTG